ncbi:MAG: cytochrome c nitrite reductase small subunit [Thermoguttaceae bacterium]|nr:cytochrome c nitrite reductase small subunit [Thermoguttaceae bacterium]
MDRLIPTEPHQPSPGPNRAAAEPLFPGNTAGLGLLGSIVGAGAGIVAGLAAWVAIISQAHSYLSDAPQTCVNCHVMRSAYASWSHSSHREAATCNDCHVPHESFLSHWLFKAQDGLRHAAVFTLRWEPQVLILSERAKRVVEDNCRRCHEEVIHEVSLAAFDPAGPRCWDCHPSPHAQPHSQSSYGLWIEGP